MFKSLQSNLETSLLTMSKLHAPSHMNHKSVLGSQLEGGEQRVSASQQVS